MLQVAQEAAAAAGFLLPIDLGARGSCQIVGVLANNAGGLRVIRHGMARDDLP
ncbi:MAG: FAD-binding protein [Paracoccaceae bacterium]